MRISIPILLLLFASFIGIFLLIFGIYNGLQDAKLNKRFQAFSLHTNEDQIISFFDRIIFHLEIFLKKFSKVLKKSTVLSKYAFSYEKYISFQEKNEKEPIYYIAIKFFVGFLCAILSIVTSLIKTKHILFLYTVFIFILGFFLPDIFLKIQFAKKKKSIEQDLMKAIMVLNNSFRSGKNIMQAIVTVKNELSGPISDEFKKIYLDMTYGLSLEVVFNRFYERIKLEDAKYIASSLTLLNKTGGNITNVFETIEKSFYNKKKMRDELKSLTASSLFVYRILVFLPLVLVSFILLLNPNYFHPLFSTPIGWILFGLILLLYISYIWVIKKILEVKI